MQHRKATVLCAIASITVNAAITALWSKTRMKHIKRRPYLSSRRAANSASLLSPCRICSSLHLRNDAPIFILVLFLARSSSFFLHCFSSKDFLFLLLFEVGNGGANRGIGIFPPCCPSAIARSLSLNQSDQVRLRAARGRGTASSLFSHTPLGSHCLCLFGRGSVLQTIMATGWTHRK